MNEFEWRKEPLTEQNEFIEVIWKCGADGRYRASLMQLHRFDEFSLSLTYRSMDKVESTGAHKYTSYWHLVFGLNQTPGVWWRPRKNPTQELLELEQQGNKKE